MDTTSHQLTNRIVAVVVTRFANQNGIVPSHLIDEPAKITPVEIMRAQRALGPEVFA